MLQKETIKPHALELLKTIQADNMFAQFHLAGGTGLALQLGHRSSVDFISHPYNLLMPIVETEQIRLYSVTDVAAMKVNAIAGNGTRSKDFVDLYFLLDQFSIDQILGFYETKYNDRNTFHAFKSLNYFDEVDLADWPVLMKNKIVTWDEVKTTIDKHCKEYFKSL